MNEKTKKIEEFALKSLESESRSSAPIEPVVDGRWRKLNDRKWEFRYNNVVLATIFHKPNNTYSLFIVSPNFYQKVHMTAADTPVFDSFGEAADQFIALLKERAVPWCNAVLGLVSRRVYDASDR